MDGGASSNGNGCRLWGYTGERICVLPSTAAGPGGRYASSAWTDRQGNFWLFGGMEIDSSGNFAISTICGSSVQRPPSGHHEAARQWESPMRAVPAVYGVPASSRQTDPRRGAGMGRPGRTIREISGYWRPKLDPNMPGPLLNDIWEFSPQLGEWAWMGGTQGANYGLDGSVAVYGQLVYRPLRTFRAAG